PRHLGRPRRMHAQRRLGRRRQAPRGELLVELVSEHRHAPILRSSLLLVTGLVSDAQIVARCRAGDQAAWNELVERFSRYVYAISTQVFRLPQPGAEDVFQEVSARVYQHLDRLRSDDAIRPWIAQLTRRLCIDRLRAGSREGPTELDEVETAELDPTLAGLDDALT